MCGIVGLFFKDRSLEPRLGELLAGMLEAMSDRGPDSAGFAIYGRGEPDRVKLTVRGEALDDVAQSIGEAIGTAPAASINDTHLVLSIPADKEEAVRAWLKAVRPELAVTGIGQRIELFKEVGRPADVARRFGLSSMSGSHGIGHTRMATESAVTTAGAHPFSTGPDQCLVHNGSLSNHRSVRRKLEREGIALSTDNDSEVAAGFLTWKIREGATLAQALETGLEELDGFYTFVVGTENGLAVMRDPISCKPAVMAETDQYVAFASEYRALAGLPDVNRATVFEPEPARVYAWERA
jgi:glutamate synthase domain-containing protein 1